MDDQFTLAKSGVSIKHPTQQQEEEVRQLARDSCPRAIFRLREILESKDDRVATSAALALLSYGIGKPIQQTVVTGAGGGAIQVEHDHSSLVAELIARRDRLLTEEKRPELFVPSTVIEPEKEPE